MLGNEHQLDRARSACAKRCPRSSVPAVVHQAQSPSRDASFAAIVDGESAINMPDMDLDGLFGDAQLLTDARVRPTRADAGKNLTLASSQRDGCCVPRQLAEGKRGQPQTFGHLRRWIELCLTSRRLRGITGCIGAVTQMEQIRDPVGMGDGGEPFHNPARKVPRQTTSIDAYGMGHAQAWRAQQAPEWVGFIAVGELDHGQAGRHRMNHGESLQWPWTMQNRWMAQCYLHALQCIG